MIVASQRIDGDDTLAEMTEVVQRTLTTAAKADGSVESWPNLKLIRGGPLLIGTSAQEAESSAAINRLALALNGRDFVVHDNTSASYIHAVLQHEGLLQNIQVGSTYHNIPQATTDKRQ